MCMMYVEWLKQNYTLQVIGYYTDEFLHGVNVGITWMGYDMDCYMDVDGCGLLHIRVTDITLHCLL